MVWRAQVKAPQFIAACATQQFHAPYLALAVDARDRSMPKALLSCWESLNKIAQVEMLFVEASQEIILNRFRETRRTHPLAMTLDETTSEGVETLTRAIALDEKILEPVRALATRVVDTSRISSQTLRQTILHDYAPSARHLELGVLLVSFGFKHGTPADLDTLFDVRCFPNPHYIAELRPLTGLDDKVAKFVLNDTQVTTFIEKTADLMNFLVPLYRSEGKRYLAVGIGCTGGKHRSVAIVEALGERLRAIIPNLKIEHRHFDRE
ncbi:RNase adapter RapZ [bacterium]|nr:RNase adapter RapZ [bacterium]